MRAAKTFFTGSIAAAAMALVACGGSSAAPPAAGIDSGVIADGGAPVTDSSAADSTVATSDAAVDAACVPSDADLNTIAPADAALDDAGASVGACIACAQSHCASQITTCNGDCACNDTFSCVFGCLSTVGGTLLGCYIDPCGGSISASGADPTELGLAECALKSCATECAACSISANICPAKDAGGGTKDAGQPDDAGGASDATGE